MAVLQFEVAIPTTVPRFSPPAIPFLLPAEHGHAAVGKDLVAVVCGEEGSEDLLGPGNTVDISHPRCLLRRDVESTPVGIDTRANTKQAINLQQQLTYQSQTVNLRTKRE
jgi:hypothetical protein